MTELKTAPKVDYFYDPHEWESTSDDPDIILDWYEQNALAVVELATLVKGPTYFVFRDFDKKIRYFDNQEEAEAAHEKMVTDQDIEETTRSSPAPRIPRHRNPSAAPSSSD